MSSPAGWYPQPDGQQRYWDGELWTDHFAPGVPSAMSPLPKSNKSHFFASTGRRFGVASSFGWGGLVLVVLIGAMSSGFSGAAIMLGLFALVVGVIALARGGVGWARLGSRATGGAVLVAALVALTVGGVTAPPSMSPSGESSTTISDAQTAADEAAAAAATQAADESAAAAAATKAADEAAAAAAPPPPDTSVYYANCTAVRAAGAAPIYPGDPGFQSKFDRDKDGIGCE